MITSKKQNNIFQVVTRGENWPLWVSSLVKFKKLERNFMKCLLREDGMGGLVRTQHLCIYVYIHSYMMRQFFLYIIDRHTYTYTHTHTQLSDEIAFHAACTNLGEEGGAGRDLPEEVMRRMTAEDMSILALARTAYIAAERSSEVCFTCSVRGCPASHVLCWAS